jgi:hypothetical protein
MSSLLEKLATNMSKVGSVNIHTRILLIFAGLQGGNVSATIKHFAAFATPEQGLNTGPVHGGERELRTTYLPPFKRIIIERWCILHHDFVQLV